MARVTILVVDDDPAMAESLADAIMTEGYDVDMACDGTAAIEMVRKKAYDAIIIDVRMPGIDGIGALKVVKSMRSSIRVMMMTAYVGSEALEDALKEGACGIWYKPLEMERVLAFVEGSHQGRVDKSQAYGPARAPLIESAGVGGR